MDMHHLLITVSIMYTRSSARLCHVPYHRISVTLILVLVRGEKRTKRTSAVQAEIEVSHWSNASPGIYSLGKKTIYHHTAG
jgi:hypothetical protein